MRRRITAVMGAAAMVLMASAASAQDAKFAGKWVVDAEKTAASNPAPQGGGQGGGRMGGGMGGGGTVMIETGKLVMVRQGRDGAEMKTEYKLDGSDTIWDGTSSSQSGSTAVVKWRTKASWDGSRLVLYTWNTALNQMRDIFSLAGGTLTIVRATEQPGPSTNATLTYTK